MSEAAFLPVYFETASSIHALGLFGNREARRSVFVHEDVRGTSMHWPSLAKTAEDPRRPQRLHSR
jgi:hypothetical protein